MKAIFKFRLRLNSLLGFALLLSFSCSFYVLPFIPLFFLCLPDTADLPQTGVYSATHLGHTADTLKTPTSTATHRGHTTGHTVVRAKALPQRPTNTATHPGDIADTGRHPFRIPLETLFLFLSVFFFSLSLCVGVRVREKEKGVHGM